MMDTNLPSYDITMNQDNVNHGISVARQFFFSFARATRKIGNWMWLPLDLKIREILDCQEIKIKGNHGSVRENLDPDEHARET